MNQNWKPLFDNPYTEPPACVACNDLRFGSRMNYSAGPCRVCGCSCAVPAKGETRSEQCSGCTKHRDLVRALWSLYRERPTIQEQDLTAAELVVIAEWRARHPHTAMLTMLGWIEGRRYDPAKDKDFLKEEFELIGQWHAALAALPV